MRDPLGFLTRCARQYGDVVRLRLGASTYYTLNHPDLVQEVLRARAAGVIKDRLTRLLSPILGQGLVTSDGTFWRRQRKLAQPAFQHQAIERYAAVMVEHALALRGAWRDGQPRHVHADMMGLTLAIVARTLFDAEVSGETRGVGEAIEVMVAYHLDPMKWFRAREWLPTRKNRRFRTAVRRLDEIIYGFIHRRRDSGHDPGDLLSRLLAAQDDEGAGMTDRQLRDECVTLFLAGHETTALTLTYAFHLLAHHPEAEARLAAELDDVLGGRPPTAADVPRLAYTGSVVRESMRLSPPAWGIGREAVEPFELGGYPVRRGTQLLISQWVLHRDSRWFDDPDAFRPERRDGDLLRSLPRGAYIPFGDGPRVCIGTHFAMMEAVLLLATLAQGHRLSAIPGQVLELVAAVTLRPRSGTRMVVHARRDPVPQAG
jgi:cytochrome P450